MEFNYYFESAVDEPKDHSRKQNAYHFTASLLKDMATAILISGKPVGTSAIAASDLYLSYDLEAEDGPVTIKDLVYINSAYARRYHKQPVKIVSDQHLANIKRAISSDEGLYFDHLEKITITGNLERFGQIVWSANRIHAIGVFCNNWAPCTVGIRRNVRVLVRHRVDGQEQSRQVAVVIPRSEV